MAPKTLKEKRNQTTHRMLKAASAIFSEVGFAGARVDEIAKRAGVNKATIYYHIGDKQALYAWVIHNLFGDAADRLARNVSKARSSVEKLKSFIRTVADTVEQHPELAAIMLREQASGGRNFPEMIAKDLARIIGILTSILQEGLKKGVFIETVPIIVHMMIIGTIVFFKMSMPIRAKFASLTETLRPIESDFKGNAASEIEKLVLNAVMKKQ